MFIIIKFGANEEQFFNLECISELLIENIRKRCNCPKNCDLALLDEKNTLLHLHENDLPKLNHRGSYTLVSVTSTEDGSRQYTPMLDNIDPQIMAKLIRLASNSKQGNVHKKTVDVKSVAAGKGKCSSGMQKTKQRNVV